MRIERFDPADIARLGGPQPLADHLRAMAPVAESVEAAVREIVATVRADGDTALIDYVTRFDSVGREPLPLSVAPDELDRALTEMPLEVVGALQVAIGNVATVAQAGVGEDVEVPLGQGQLVRLRETPVERAAVYVPGGRAPYPSTVVMGVVTARAAGVLDVSVCSPPGPGGDIDPLILGTCRLCGVSAVYRMGGAHAVAALAYGTATIPRQDVIVGPGNLYVQEAKRQIAGTAAGIDGFAGPSDLMVIAAPDAPAELVALDLLAQAEHGPESVVAAVSPSAAWLDALEAELARVGARHPQLEPGPVALIAASDLEQAWALADGFAPEHLQLVGAEAEALSTRVRRAGALLVGAASGTAFGDYVAGSNHVLPTGGTARFASGLSTRHFRRRMSEVRLGPAAPKLATSGARIALAEGFVVHAESMRARATPADAQLGEN